MLRVDLGRARVVELPAEETERRWRITTPQWPIMHAVLDGVTRDQLMARHKSNHVQVPYAPDAAGADLALASKAAAFREMGRPPRLLESVFNGLGVPRDHSEEYPRRAIRPRSALFPVLQGGGLETELGGELRLAQTEPPP